MTEPATVLITGASEGIGRAFAEIAAERGYGLVLAARSEDKLEALSKELRKEHGVAVRVIPTDLSDPEAVDTLWSEATRHARIGWLINNAGLGSNGRFDDPDGWPRELASIQVNLLALTRLTKLAVPYMQDHATDATGPGRILNVASLAGFMPGPNMAVYHATKAYVLSLSEALAREMSTDRVTVTALCPGATESAFFSAAEMGGVPVTKMGRLPSSHSVALSGWEGAQAGRVIVVPGASNKFLAFATRFLPRGLLTIIAGKLLKRPD